MPILSRKVKFLLKVACFQPCNVLDTLDKHVAQVQQKH